MKTKFSRLFYRATLFVATVTIVSSQFASVARAIDPLSITHDVTYGPRMGYDTVKQDMYYGDGMGVNIAFRSPVSYMFVKPGGNIYTIAVCTNYTQAIDNKICVKEFSSTTGHYIGKTQLDLAGASPYPNPSSFAMDSTGNFYAGDSSNNRILVFSSNGSLLRTINTSTTDIQYVDATGNLYIIDTANSQIKLLQPNGTQIAQFGSNGIGDGQFTNPKQLL